MNCARNGRPVFQDNSVPHEKLNDDSQAGWTLPGHYYFDPDIYQQELKRIFYRNWQYVCHVSRLKESGSFFVRDIGDQSVLAIRDADGEIRVYHNICQHRLLEEEGQINQRIVCP